MVTVTFEAKSGPLLLISTEYLMLLPGVTGSGESAILIDKSDKTAETFSLADSREPAFTVLPENAPNNVMSKEKASTETAKTAPRPIGAKRVLNLFKLGKEIFFL